MEVRRQKHETTKTKTRKHEDENVKNTKERWRRCKTRLRRLDNYRLENITNVFSRVKITEKNAMALTEHRKFHVREIAKKHEITKVRWRTREITKINTTKKPRIDTSLNLICNLVLFFFSEFVVVIFSTETCMHNYASAFKYEIQA